MYITFLQELCPEPDEVSQCVVFLVDGEDGGVGHLRVLLLGDLLLAVEQQERLEGRRGVHLAERGPLGMILKGWSR